MSYWSVRNLATTFDPLNGSTSGTVANGTAAYRAGGPFGQQMFDFNASRAINYGSVGELSPHGSIAFWVDQDQASPAGTTAIATVQDAIVATQNAGSRNVDGYVNQSPATFVHLDAASTPSGLTHAAIVADGSTVKLYINGEEHDSQTCGDLGTRGNDVLRLGRDHNGNLPFDGGVGEFGWWNGIALSAAQVLQLKNGPEPTYTSGATLLVRATTITGSVGTWNSHGNGDATFEWKILDEDFNEIASGTGDTIAESGLTNLPGLYTLHVRATNDGGYDEGDGLDGLGGGNGYYKVAEYNASIGSDSNLRRFDLPRFSLPTT